MKDSLRRLFTSVLAPGTGTAKPSYSSILINTYGASEVWPLVDIASGTTITAKVSSARNGTLTGWTLQNAAGPVPGTLAPYSHGSVDGSNIKTASFESIFSGQIGSMFIWGKIFDATVQNDGTKDTLWYILGPSSLNYIVLRKYEGTGANRGVIALTKWGNVDQSWFYATTATLNWFSLGFSWDKTAAAGAGEGKFYFNGTQQAGTKTFGTWDAGALIYNVLGCSQVPNIDVFNGWMAYAACKFGSVWSPADFAGMHAAAATAGPG